MKNEKQFNPRDFMLKAIDVMHQSIQEQRIDKVSPKVGALLIKSDGSIDTAFRGELRDGDHAEFTLLERKNRNISLADSILFSTLEPCAPGARKHPKLSCAERIVNARIKKVWIGIEDPDPTVDRKGIQFLLKHGIEVELFDVDLQAIIREANKQFIIEAEERATREKEKPHEIILSNKEQGESKAHLEDLSQEIILKFIDRAQLSIEYPSKDFLHIFNQLGLLEYKEDQYIPTGLGLLLFGKRPQLVYHNAMIRATHKSVDREEEVRNIEGSLITQSQEIMSWYEEKIGKHISRVHAEREVIYDYPMEAIRESIINAIVHRDYDIEGAPIYFEINDNAIIIKSPGKPVEPLRLEQVQQFIAPSLSRNPKIMYIFDQMKLVEQRGLGFQTLKELPIKYHIPLPFVTYDDPYMIFIFPRKFEFIKNALDNKEINELTAEELKGYDYIRTIETITRKEYQEHFGLEEKTAERQLKHMTELGLIDRKGGGRSTYYEIKMPQSRQ